MLRALLLLIGLALAPSLAMGCGLDWTLPANHFDGVNEQGYVEYWEKIGEADLGDGLVIPVNISFNSHQEASSPTLGKGWMVALLESHVEPVNENSMNVLMPDGWTFTFLRNGSTETWRGNAGWVGETKNTVFTITAPCGWKIKFDGGKIQEIDSNKNRTLTYKYNGPVATEVDVDNKAFVQVESNTSTGVAEDLFIGGQKIDLSLAQRPRIQTMLKQNLITAFDQSLNQLQWPDGKKESFTFGTDKSLNPTLAITHSDQTQRNFTWNPTTRQIMIDGEWVYDHLPSNGSITFERKNGQGPIELWQYDGSTGKETIVGLDGIRRERYWFTSGTLAGLTRRIIEYDHNGNKIGDYKITLNENGKIIRELNNTSDVNALSERMFDGQGRILEIRANNGLIKIYKYDSDRTTETDYNLDGVSITRTMYNNGAETIKFSNGRYIELDSKKRPVSQVLKNGDSLNYAYDEVDHTTKISKNGKLMTIIQYDSSNHEKEITYYNEAGAVAYNFKTK